MAITRGNVEFASSEVSSDVTVTTGVRLCEEVVGGPMKGNN